MIVPGLNIVGSMIFWVVLSLTQGILYGAIESGALSFVSTTQAGQIRFILLKPLGAPLITTVPQEALLATLQACGAD